MSVVQLARQCVAFTLLLDETIRVANSMSHKESIKKAKEGKITKVMREFKERELHSGSKKGPVVKNRKQAIAISLSEARKHNK